jgi:hypothetical protein
MYTDESVKLNEEVFTNIQITSQENMIIKSFEKFYQVPENIRLFISIISSESSISIRLIDHYVTKYSKNNKIVYKLNENNNDHQFNVYTSYKQQLKAFQKKHFDPFSRGDRIPYFMGNTCIITTIGQLNFFKWFISKKIYENINLNTVVIENDMNKKIKIEKIKIKPNNKIVKKTAIILQSYKAPIVNTRINDTNKMLCDSKTDKIMVTFSFN